MSIVNQENNTTNMISNEVQALTQSLTRCYEEITLLHRMSEGMCVTQRPEDFFADLCEDIHDVLEAQQFMVLLGPGQEDQGEVRLVASYGDLYLSGDQISLIWNRTTSHSNPLSNVLIDSNVDGPYLYEWPKQINNILAVSIQRDDKILGVLVAINKTSATDFDSNDLKMMISLANQGGIYLENFKLYHDLQDLMFGVLRALTSSIDAKDPYTCGHSERVALISKWLAEKMGLDAKAVQETYLGGLLHDVGKIGISEAVLTKDGKLTDEEFREIQKHPQIGADILKEIKPLAEVNRAVLTHHERLDGRGYPNNLTEESIPQIGKIVGLADSFDAMISERVYRQAMTVQQALEEIKRCRGTHFDTEMADLLIDSDVQELLDSLDQVKSYQQEKHNLYYQVQLN